MPRLLVFAATVLLVASCSTSDDDGEGVSGKGASSGGPARAGGASGHVGAGAGAGGSSGAAAGRWSGGMSTGGTPGGGMPGGGTAGGSGGSTPSLGGMGGAGDTGGEAGADDDDAISPQDLDVMALDGGNGVLELVALTLRQGPAGPELYAALKNVGDMPACEAGFSVELYDKAEQSVGAGIAGLYTEHLYRLTDGSDTIVACVGPGDITMTAVTDLPADIVVDDVGFLVYRCPYFALDVEPIAGLSVSQLEAVTSSSATMYIGKVTNGLDASVTDPSVAVFPVNGAGRPLGMATALGMRELASGDSWSFETGEVESPGVDQVAYPSASP